MKTFLQEFESDLAAPSETWTAEQWKYVAIMACRALDELEKEPAAPTTLAELIPPKRAKRGRPLKMLEGSNRSYTLEEMDERLYRMVEQKKAEMHTSKDKDAIRELWKPYCKNKRELDKFVEYDAKRLSKHKKKIA